jgi:hypothetical protein
VHTCGYVYAIGDCAGAVEEKPCPRCGGVLGGLQHKLRPDSYHLPLGSAKPESWMGERSKETLPSHLQAAAAASGVLSGGVTSGGAGGSSSSKMAGSQTGGPASSPTWKPEIRWLN